MTSLGCSRAGLYKFVMLSYLQSSFLTFGVTFISIVSVYVVLLSYNIKVKFDALTIILLIF